MTSKLRAAQEEARELIRDSIVEDAISRFIAQILEVAAKDRADRLAATLARADALEAALKRTEANRDAAMEDAAEEYARAERAEALLAEAVEALAKAQWSLQPFSDCVFNDNGDITVTVSDRVTSADCLTDAHFAYKRIRATLTRIQEATKSGSQFNGPRDIPSADERAISAWNTRTPDAATLARAERAEALLAEAVEAIEYFMDGWGLDAPEYSLDPEDDELFEHEWAFDKFRATLARIQEQRNDL